jgi:hypothetical protein
MIDRLMGEMVGAGSDGGGGISQKWCQMSSKNFSRLNFPSIRFEFSPNRHANGM